MTDSLKKALAPYPSDKDDLAERLKESFGKFLDTNYKPPYHMASDEKLAALFSADNSNHQARFNKLITPEVMEENHIAKTCGRPVTWQYQG